MGDTAILNRMTDRTRKVLDLSLREALSLGHNYVGTEHLLLALTRDTESLAFRALDGLIGQDRVRNEVIRLLEGKKQTEEELIAAESEPTTEPRSTALDIAKEMVERHMAGAPERAWTELNAAPVVEALALVAIAEALTGEKP